LYNITEETMTQSLQWSIAYSVISTRRVYVKVEIYYYYYYYSPNRYSSTRQLSFQAIEC
jgi:hypothetical protein